MVVIIVTSLETSQFDAPIRTQAFNLPKKGNPSANQDQSTGSIQNYYFQVLAMRIISTMISNSEVQAPALMQTGKNKWIHVSKTTDTCQDIDTISDASDLSCLDPPILNHLHDLVSTMTLEGQVLVICKDSQFQR